MRVNVAVVLQPASSRTGNNGRNFFKFIHMKLPETRGFVKLISALERVPAFGNPRENEFL